MLSEEHPTSLTLTSDLAHNILVATSEVESTAYTYSRERDGNINKHLGYGTFEEYSHPHLNMLGEAERRFDIR
jgi:hypothetical protein